LAVISVIGEGHSANQIVKLPRFYIYKSAANSSGRDSLITFEIQGDALILSGGHSVTFPHKIWTVDQAHHVLIVLLDVPSGVVMTENVYGVSESGEMLWEIERIPETSRKPTNLYTGIIEHDHQTALLYNSKGFEVKIDIHTGKVLGTEFVK
jgi:hypothetical protein